MFTSLLVSLLVCLGVCPPGEAPGIVVVVGGDLRPVTFSLPTSIDYQLSYDAARLALWLDPAQTLPAPPLTTFQSPGQIVHGDLNGDALVDGADFKIFVAVVLGVNTDPIVIAQADFDESGVADVSDAPLFVDALLAPGSSQNTGVILYAEGLTASTDLCDTSVDLLTDPQGTGSFALADTAQVTVAELTISPQTGGLGTQVTITLTPAIAPLIFDANTTATWTGVFQPMVGTPSNSFQFQYDASQFNEQGPGQAIIVVGDGTVTNAPDLATVLGPGSIVGTVTVPLAGLSVEGSFTFNPSPAGTWQEIDYLDSAISTGPPVLGSEPTTLEVMVLSIEDDPANQSEFTLLHAYGFHYAAVVRIEENPTTIANAPTTLAVDLVTLDPAGVEVDRFANLTLTRVAGDDGDPANLVYHNDLTVPIILVDFPLNQAAFPNVILMEMPTGGSGLAMIVPNVP